MLQSPPPPPSPARPPLPPGPGLRHWVVLLLHHLPTPSARPEPCCQGRPALYGSAFERRRGKRRCPRYRARGRTRPSGVGGRGTGGGTPGARPGADGGAPRSAARHKGERRRERPGATSGAGSGAARSCAQPGGAPGSRRVVGCVLSCVTGEAILPLCSALTDLTCSTASGCGVLSTGGMWSCWSAS